MVKDVYITPDFAPTTNTRAEKVITCRLKTNSKWSYAGSGTANPTKAPKFL